MQKTGKCVKLFVISNSDIQSCFAVLRTAASYLQYNHQMHDKRTHTRDMIMESTLHSQYVLQFTEDDYDLHKSHSLQTIFPISLHKINT